MKNKKGNIFIMLLLLFSIVISACTQSKIDESKYMMFKPEKTWAVLMEMNDFPGEESDLIVDFINTKRMKETLIKLGVKETQIKIYENDISIESVIDAIDWLNKNSNEGDTVLFYVMTHGGWLKNKAAWNNIFPKRWKNLKDRQQILIVDCCGAENYIGAFEDDQSSEISIASCSSDEKSWVGLEREGLPIIGNVWTYYFTQAVFDTKADINKDKMITLEEAFSLAALNTQKYMAEVVFKVDEFLQMYLEAGGSLDKIGKDPNPVMYNHNSKELILYIIP